MRGSAITIAGQAWNLGPLIGSGGFGEVRMAESSGQIAAVKLVPKDPGADRELLFADDLRDTPNVLPILGTGETASHWALLMPLADKSLRRYLLECSRPLSEAEALPVLANLTTALAHLADRGVVHRDLKPENILLHKGAWCLSDFGISRYTDATTATDTRKYSTTRPYMAPEQWREETATPAADVYALGVISHELLTGLRPFPGPDFRHQHLHQDAPPLGTATPAFAALIDQCLFKLPGTRPTARDALRDLERLGPSSPKPRGLADLQAANFEAVGQGAARATRQESEALTRDEHVRTLLAAARKQFEQISTEVKEAIQSVVTPTSVVDGDSGWQLFLNAAAIGMHGCSELAYSPRLRDLPDRRKLPFDVVACATIAISGFQNPGKHVGRAHSLWFCDAHEAGMYRWYEVAFAGSLQEYFGRHESYFSDVRGPLRHTNGFYVPNAISRLDDVGKVVGMFKSPTPVPYLQAVWPFTRLEVGNLSEFIDRWATWLAEASRGLLQSPEYGRWQDTPQSWRSSTVPRISHAIATPTPTPRKQNEKTDTSATAQDAIMEEFKDFLRAGGMEFGEESP